MFGPNSVTLLGDMEGDAKEAHSTEIFKNEKMKTLLETKMNF